MYTVMHRYNVIKCTMQNSKSEVHIHSTGYLKFSLLYGNVEHFSHDSWVFSFGSHKKMISFHFIFSIMIIMSPQQGHLLLMNTFFELRITTNRNIDGLAQDCSNSNALALELLQSCTKPLIYIVMHICPTEIDIIQCNAIIASSIFSQQTPHSTPVRARYGVSWESKVWFMFCLSRCRALCNIINRPRYNS